MHTCLSNERMDSRFGLVILRHEIHLTLNSYESGIFQRLSHSQANDFISNVLRGQKH